MLAGEGVEGRDAAAVGVEGGGGGAVAVVVVVVWEAAVWVAAWEA